MKASSVLVQGKIVHLRDWIPADVQLYKEWMRPGHEWQKLDGPYYQSNEDKSESIAATLSEKIAKGDFPEIRERLVIADAKTNEFLGTIVSYWESKETNWLCIGLTIYNPRDWSRGVGFESMTLWIDFLFKNRPELVRLDIRTWSGNAGAQKLALKLGFQQEACFRMARIVEGKYYDSLGYGILRSEWESQRRG
ncbi:GNAT family N-acetyltransferase [Bdellovibrio sp. HCB337]|uniref:GNAT family N-acetyltransferase n=1 Tax=Bdellovibrio sp. HCB337 TaxID=3394358 RepID=UPI0039A76776